MDTRYMVFGIQESGKTTFAAALWHLVDSEEIPTVLIKGRHVGDFTYLQEISGSWAEAYEVERTKSQQFENVHVNLLHAASGNEMTLEFDDLSGETLEQAFATRYCPEKFVELVRSADGMLLFLSASRRNDDAVTILDVFDAEEDATQTPADPNHWEPEKAPLQVQLVDLLQCLQRPPFEAKPMKVALVVSAWDLAPDGGTNADKWLKDRYPLLSQYLENSEGVLDLKVYGVSAQGGRLSKKKDGPGPDRDKLLAIVPASKRIRIVGPEVSEHDITRPLLWLAGLEFSGLNDVSRGSIDQALFGYADGHRQIASSVRLPPKDLYLLSSASDLASGARLGERDSYLSGLPLLESRRYALLRTWAAPEMPRPGCVWSHVLLLGPAISSSIAAFSEVLPFFRRPANETSSYGHPLEISTSPFVEPARADLISEIISGYYTSGRATLSPASGEPDEIENAVLAVWSQQWPRLRSSFSFCTASLNENRRTEQSDYSVQIAPPDRAPLDSREKWVSFASGDAALNKVTPLRRFLWRYGRDIATSRRHFRMIVNLYLYSEGLDSISVDAALDVFHALPDPSDGAILKRDILGIGPRSPRLVPALSVVEFLQLLTSGALPEPPTAAQVGHRLDELSSRDAGNIARYYGANKEVLSPWKNEIYGAIVALADKASITTEYPTDMVADVLLAREDLVDADTLPLLANDVLSRLIKDNTFSLTARSIMNEMLRRDMGDLEDAIIGSRPELVLQSAVEAYCDNRLHQSWSGRLYQHVGTILAANWLPGLKSTKEFATALSILGYPRNLLKGSAEIARHLSGMADNAQGNERTTMQAALLRAAIDEGSAQSWNLIAIVLPELRVVIIDAGLPRTAESMLVSDLPHFYSAGYWDLNKRILLSLSKLNLVAPNSDALHRLALTPAEMDLVLHGEDRPTKNPLLKIWHWPF